MEIVIDLAGIGGSKNAVLQPLVDVCESFGGDYWFVDMPNRPDRLVGSNVLITDNRPRAVEWSGDGGFAIYLASVGRSTADTVLIELIEHKRRLIASAKKSI